jgi:hypothetical protein
MKQYQTLDSKIDRRSQTSKVIPTTRHSLCMQPRLTSKYVYVSRIPAFTTEVRHYYILYIVRSSRNSVLAVLQNIKAPTFDYAVSNSSHTALESRCRRVTICLTSRSRMPYSQETITKLVLLNQLSQSLKCELIRLVTKLLLSTV